MVGNPFSDAVGDIFGGIGDLAEASAYGKSASLDEQNAAIAAQSTKIQQAQLSRSIYQTEGAGVAAAAANGVSGYGGSAGAIFRSSAQQGGLAHQLLGRQGLINENSYEAQAEAAKGMQSSLTASAFGSFLSAPLGFLGIK
jgi:hypothetical protein